MKRSNDVVKRHGAGVTTPDLHDLDELQVVSKKAYRRGYTAQVDGRLMRLKYRKIMSTPDRQLLVFRPAAGEERLKDTTRRLGKGIGLFLVVAWPFTLAGAVVLLAVLVSALR